MTLDLVSRHDHQAYSHPRISDVIFVFHIVLRPPRFFQKPIAGLSIKSKINFDGIEN